jgi:hypothetical protein
MPRIYKRDCDNCGKYYESAARRFCSHLCYTANPEVRAANSARQLGRPSPLKGRKIKNVKPECIAALRNWQKQNGVWNKGTKGLTKRNSGSFTTDRVKGEKNHNWKGGVTPEHHRIRSCKEYAEWRMKVFQRDRFTCVICGHRSKYRFGKEKCDIRADHIKPFCLYQELRFDVDNGRTLCVPCDLEHGWNSLKEMNNAINFHKKSKS